MTEFDYIVVGAGSAGSVIAARLAERPGVTVALIEAGARHRSPWLRVPLGFGRLLRDPRLLWPYSTASEPALDGRRIPFPRGRLLGGSGSVNGLVFLRGAPGDYDAWAAEGARGWAWDDVLPWFRKTETNLIPGTDPAFHGDAGPIPVSRIRPSAAGRAFVAAALEAGHAAAPDFNGADPRGAGFAPANMRAGLRVSPAEAWLKPALRQGRGISLFLKAEVERITFRDGRACGIVLRRPDGSEEQLSARAEVVLCAGVIGTPMILMRSGIGPGETLRRFGIPVLRDLRVGQGMQDHALARFSFRARNVVTLNRVMRNPLRGAAVALQYLLRRDGPLAVAAAEAVVMADLAPGKPPGSSPDVLIQFANFLIESYEAGLSSHDGFVASVCLCRPESRGRVTLSGPGLGDLPVIEAGYFTAPADMERTVAGLRLLEHITRQPSLARITEARIAPARMETEADLRAHVRATATTVFHPCGTCAMGEGPDSVVSPELKLHGVAGLRVADASVMPSIPSTNIHAAVLMIAERAAAMIGKG